MGSKQVVDIRLGSLIRSRRIELGKSQLWLAEQLKLTFQQVQKYEKGVNRVSASRLVQIAEALKTKLSFFFKDFENGADTTASDLYVQVQHASTARLVRAFATINDSTVRVAITDMVEAIAERKG